MLADLNITFNNNNSNNTNSNNNKHLHSAIKSYNENINNVTVPLYRIPCKHQWYEYLSRDRNGSFFEQMFVKDIFPSLFHCSVKLHREE